MQIEWKDFKDPMIVRGWRNLNKTRKIVTSWRDG